MSEYIKREDVYERLVAHLPKHQERIEQILNNVPSIEIDDWTPVSERLPEKNGDYIVSLEDSIYPCGRFFNGKWYMLPRDGVAVEFGANEVIAWQPLPEPYNGGDKE